MATEKKKRCFVVMGFGQKTDYATGRTLDLDKTYRIIIKKAVEDAGLECIRADDVIHSGVIDKPMYELLLDADVVVADLSTSNANAIYELGVRHALRPHTTILMAEDQFKFPFDIAHVAIRTYEHLGKGIDAEEAEQARESLKLAIIELVDKQETDSPVYTFLPQLSPPGTGGPGATETQAMAPAATDEGTSTSAVMGLFQQARAKGDWGMAKGLLASLTQKTPPVTDTYVLQQLALATYKSRQPDAKAALEQAKKVLQQLKPLTTTDPETLGLWGAIHKRLWELEANPQHLDDAIRAHEKGFYVKDDYYNGINLAFLLNVRASKSDSRDAVADFVRAERVRRRVITICENLLADGVKDDDGNPDREETFWLRATLVEALLGTGSTQKAEELKALAVADAPESWMPESMNEQIAKLEPLIANEPVCG